MRRPILANLGTQPVVVRDNGVEVVFPPGPAPAGTEAHWDAARAQYPGVCALVDGTRFDKSPDPSRQVATPDPLPAFDVVELDEAKFDVVELDEAKPEPPEAEDGDDEITPEDTRPARTVRPEYTGEDMSIPSLSVDPESQS
jgi:hypothetical protein